MAPHLRGHIELYQDCHLHIPQEETGAKRIQKAWPMAAHSIAAGVGLVPGLRIPAPEFIPTIH